MEYIINFILLAFIYTFILYRRWVKKSTEELILHTLMYIYIVMVLFVTLMPFPIPFGATNHLFMESANFIPFRDLIANYNGAEREIILNIVMMVPFGFLYPLIKQKGFIKTVAFTFLFSLLIESSQLLTVWWASLHSRSFDVTDLITNTFGGLVGYIICKILRLPSHIKKY